MRNAKHADERLQFANVLDKLVKLAPVFKSVWTVAKTALGL
jgi:hypothetical protein